MIFDDHRNLLAPNDSKYDLYSHFDSYCFTATILIQKGLAIKSHHTHFPGQILQAEHPRTLACFLKVFIYLIQNRLPEVTSYLRDFIKRISIIVTTKGHLWGQIYQLFGKLDSESLDQAIVQA